METPNDEAGRLTEEMMRAWRRRLDERKEPPPSVVTYNAAYESAYEILRRFTR